MEVSSSGPPSIAKPTFAQRYAGAVLALVAVAIAGFAGVRWARVMGGEPQAVATTSDTRAWALLGRALKANNQVPFAARVDTVVFVGARGLQSEARLVSAPDHLAINYLSGPMKGQHRGFSNRMFWRQSAAGQLTPYAAVADSPEQTAQRRFELMRANYQAHLQAPREISGRPVEVVEIRPSRPILGTMGPARRFFIDDATGLTLRIEAFNSRLQPSSHSTFSRLDFHSPALSSAFHTPATIVAAAQQSFWRGEELGDNARAVERKTGIEPPQSQRIPRGWERDGFGVHRCDGAGNVMQVAAFTRYTDGLNVLTLFAMKNATRDRALPAPSAQVYRCSFGPGTLISRAEGAGTLLAIGDLPPEILRRVLDDARFKEAVIVAPTVAPVTAPTLAPMER